MDHIHELQGLTNGSCYVNVMPVVVYSNVIIKTGQNRLLNTAKYSVSFSEERSHLWALSDLGQPRIFSVLLDLNFISQHH